MTTKDFCEKLDLILEEETGTITPETHLRDTEWDSMSTMGFIALVSKEFGMTVSPKELVKCRAIGDLIKLLGDHVSAE